MTLNFNKKNNSLLKNYLIENSSFNAEQLSYFNELSQEVYLSINDNFEGKKYGIIIKIEEKINGIINISIFMNEKNMFRFSSQFLEKFRNHLKNILNNRLLNGF